MTQIITDTVIETTEAVKASKLNKEEPPDTVEWWDAYMHGVIEQLELRGFAIQKRIADHESMAIIYSKISGGYLVELSLVSVRLPDYNGVIGSQLTETRSLIAGDA